MKLQTKKRFLWRVKVEKLFSHLPELKDMKAGKDYGGEMRQHSTPPKKGKEMKKL